jgi:ketosteroid isomerase-like protein
MYLQGEIVMTDDIALIQRLYDRFNARDINGVLTALAADVAWANAMEGGHVHGGAAVRDYWTRQWAIVSPRVEPIGFETKAGDMIIAKVRQSIRDLNGEPLSGHAHGLSDKILYHIFHLRDGLVTRFDVEDLADHQPSA